MLEAPAGQRINISLLDFTAAARLTSQHLTRSTSHVITSSSSSGSCVDEKHQYGYIIDKSSVNKKNVSVCHARSNRQTHVYLSTSNTAQLVLNNDQTGNFLIKVQGIIIRIVTHSSNTVYYSNSSVLIGRQLCRLLLVLLWLCLLQLLAVLTWFHLRMRGSNEKMTRSSSVVTRHDRRGSCVVMTAGGLASSPTAATVWIRIFVYVNMHYTTCMLRQFVSNLAVTTTIGSWPIAVIVVVVVLKYSNC